MPDYKEADLDSEEYRFLVAWSLLTEAARDVVDAWWQTLDSVTDVDSPLRDQRRRIPRAVNSLSNRLAGMDHFFPERMAALPTFKPADEQVVNDGAE